MKDLKLPTFKMQYFLEPHAISLVKARRMQYYIRALDMVLGSDVRITSEKCQTIK